MENPSKESSGVRNRQNREDEGNRRRDRGRSNESIQV